MKVQQPVVHRLLLVGNTAEMPPSVHIPRADTHSNIGPRGVVQMSVNQLAKDCG